MRAGAGVAGLPLEVLESGVHGLPDHGVDLFDESRPVLIAVLVSCLAGQARILAEGGVEEHRALPGLPGGFDPQLASASGGGVRFGGQQPGVRDGGLAAAARRSAELGAVRGFAFAEQQVVRFAVDLLAVLEAECLRARTPLAARRFSPLSLARM